MTTAHTMAEMENVGLENVRPNQRAGKTTTSGNKFLASDGE